VTLKPGVDMFKVSEIAPFDRSYTTFYWSAIVTIALPRTIFKLLNVEYYRDLEIWVIGH